MHVAHRESDSRSTVSLTCRTLVALFLLPLIAGAAPLDWSVSLYPTPNISGPPGSTIGWGYQIENLDQANWLVLTSLSADPFLFAVPLDIFDYPILGPGESITLPYDPAVPEGLYQITWDPSAPIGTTETGIFALTADFYDNDPFDPESPGRVVAADNPRFAPYTATVTPRQVIPEPATLWMSVPLLVGGFFARRRCRLCFARD